MLDQTSVVLITGANSGIGKATATALAKTGATIVMACRSLERGKPAKKEIETASGSQKIELLQCDLSSLQSIKDFCAAFRKKHNRLHVLINNAAVIKPGYHRTQDGFELQFGVNHLGHFLLTNALIDLMQPAGRIITVSSGAHKWGNIDFDDIHYTRRFSFWRAYSRSKLANVLFTYELSRRLRHQGITSNCLHPGAVATQLGIDRDTGFGKFITGLLKPFFKTPGQGAEALIYLATQNEHPDLTGQYFVDNKPARSSKISYNEELAGKLWDVSNELLGISQDRL